MKSNGKPISCAMGNCILTEYFQLARNGKSRGYTDLAFVCRAGTTDCRILQPYGDLNERQCSAAERLVLAIDEREITPYLRVRDGNCCQDFPARMSSCTFDRAIKPTPTSAATKRLSNSLESNSMETVVLMCRRSPKS